MSSPEPQSSRYRFRERSSNRRKPPFEVPEWAGANSYNTCIVDSFLAMLLCAQHREPTFASLVRGECKFTQACRAFLEDNGSEMEDRKMIFIKKLFRTDNHGEFNLEGDEVSVILDKAKEACTFGIETHCPSCDKRASTKRDYFYSGMDKKISKMSELLYTAIVRPDRKHRCTAPESCKDVEKQIELKTYDSTWMLPIDFSQMDLLPGEKIGPLPPIIEVAEVKYRLTGVSLFGDAHYTAVLHDQSEWYYYDGLLTPTLRTYSNLKSMVFDPSCRIKIAYYLRADE